MDNTELFISNLPSVEVGIKHVFEPGVYIRKMYLPAGAILTSKVHRTKHHFIISKGKILVYDGIHKAVILKASYDGTTMPGTRRMGVALEDVIWMNIHPTRIKPVNDSEASIQEAVNKIEKRVIEPYHNLKLTQ